MLDRLREEQLKRSTALLYPLSNAWQLEVTNGENGWILEGPEPQTAGTGLIQAVNWARKTLGTDMVHIENLAGLALDRIPALAEGGRIIIAAHDFSAYCQRPHLMEQPRSIFCDYSSDPNRCRICLAHDWQLPPDAAEVHRQLGQNAFMAADRLIFPSIFLKDQYQQLFSKIDLAARARVIEPATDARVTTKARHSKRPHIAFVGGIKGHKGGRLVVETAAQLRQNSAELHLTSYGDGDFDLLQELKSATHVRVGGYYRSGKLPNLLVRDGVDVAILPSIWPESYGLVVDECLRAGIPVAAFDLGAVGPRLSSLAAGRVVPIGEGAKGLASAALHLLEQGDIDIDNSVIEKLPTPRKVAEQYLELYREFEE